MARLNDDWGDLLYIMDIFLASQTHLSKILPVDLHSLDSQKLYLYCCELGAKINIQIWLTFGKVTSSKNTTEQTEYEWIIFVHNAVVFHSVI